MSNTLSLSVWAPHDAPSTNVAKFMDHVNKRNGLQLQTYADLHAWSVGATTFQDFWQEAYSWLQLSPPGTKGPGMMLNVQDPTTIPLFPPPTFFPAAKLNLAEILLRNGKDADVAIHFAREGQRDIERVTWEMLRARTRAARDALLSSGVGTGDVVAAVMGNSVDAIVLCLAALSVGAVWSSSSCDLGVEGIVDRYGQAGPKVIFADDGYVYAGKVVNLGARIAEWASKIGEKVKGLGHVVVLPYCGVEVDVARVHGGCTFEEFLSRGVGREMGFAMLPFSHPGFILYSSGTTGTPKCIVHSAGGVALKVKTDMILQHDVRPDDIVFQYTTTSWVMWVLNFVNISSGASMLLYDGSPFHPTPTILLRLAQETGVSIFGTSPRYLEELRSRNIVPRNQFDLDRLRVVTSTGSTLSADLSIWFYNTAFPPRAQLVSMSGGTDIAGCFVGGTPLLPVFSGEIQAAALGMAVEIFSAAETEPVSVERSDEPGELVCLRPFPSQPLRFLGAMGEEKYRSSYFERFGTRVWCQGDFVRRVEVTGGIVMLGRSDGVLNPSGVRFGSAEIYSVTERISEIADSICVGQRRDVDSDERVLLFVKMQPGKKFTAKLEGQIRKAIKERYTLRHVPRYIFEVADIPYTVNGKKCEINIKHVVSGRKAVVSGTVANPQALKLYERFRNLPVEGAAAVARGNKL